MGMRRAFCPTCKRRFGVRPSTIREGHAPTCPRCRAEGTSVQRPERKPRPPSLSQRGETTDPPQRPLPLQTEEFARALGEAGLTLSDEPHHETICLGPVREAHGFIRTQWATCGPHGLRLLIQQPYFSGDPWNASILISGPARAEPPKAQQDSLLKEFEQRVRGKYEPHGFRNTGPATGSLDITGTWSASDFLESTHPNVTSLAKWIAAVWRLDRSPPPPAGPSENRPS